MIVLYLVAIDSQADVCLFYSVLYWIITVKKESVRTMLSVVTYLRTQNVTKRGRGQGTQWDNNFWLELDYLEVASAAQRCSAYFTALLYTEIWADIERLSLHDCIERNNFNWRHSKERNWQEATS